MITLTGQIDLNTEAAPDVALRQGDTMRQSEFEVKQDIDLENCSVDVFMVKPDSTFVISTCSITDNGKILVSWPEQAAAVKGLGEYCIRISDNNSGYVFSARGRVWIDDHCVLDGMIESIAEVNGYVFPDDFALRSEIPVVEDVINDDDISNETTWSSNKINDIISASLNMIEGERVIGKFLNKTLYERVIVNDNLSYVSVSSYRYYSIFSSSDIVDDIWFCGGYVHDNYNDRNYILPYDRYYSSIDKAIPELYSTPTGYVAAITIPASSGYNLDKAVMIIRYTKS